MTLITIAAILTGLKLYDKLARHGGAGTLVPITGFANAVVAPAIEYKSEGFIQGVGTKMFSIAGPVLVYGIAASALYGVLYFLFG
jgi:stage V sporulation protein AC